MRNALRFVDSKAFSILETGKKVDFFSAIDFNQKTCLFAPFALQ
jgi:hypothetical protein